MHTLLTLEYNVQGLAHRKQWNPVRQTSYTEEFLLMSADLRKQIGIWRGTTLFNMKTVYIKQNGNFEKSQELKGRSQKFKNL
jgi:hypothetical protein